MAIVKQLGIYLCLSILVVLLAEYIQFSIIYIDTFYTHLNLWLAPIFSHSSLGVQIRQIVSLVLIPIAVVGLPAVIYRLLKGGSMPYFYPALWLVWVIVVLSKILIQ